MPHDVHERSEIQALLDNGAQCVDVLGPQEFENSHLPGAINIPLRKIENQAGDLLDRSRPVIVYCWDSA